MPDHLFYPVDTKKPEAAAETTGADETTNKTAGNGSPEPREEKSIYGHNALTRVFHENFDDAWDNVLDAMLNLPLISVDKSGGILITGWILDEGMSDSVFGGGKRLVRYKYVVRLKDIGGASEVTVIPFAQVSKNRRWRDAKPAVIISEKLLINIIAKMEE